MINFDRPYVIVDQRDRELARERSILCGQKMARTFGCVTLMIMNNATIATLPVEIRDSHPLWALLDRHAAALEDAYHVARELYLAAVARGDLAGADRAAHLARHLADGVRALQGGEGPLFNDADGTEF